MAMKASDVTYMYIRIGVMTKLPNEEGKNPIKNISRH